MTLSIDSPDFQISSSFEIPESLRQLLYQAWQNRYKELYEELADGTITLEETLLEILDALGDNDDSLSHPRYVCMALILALAVEPTVKAYLPSDRKTEQIFKLLINWLKDKEALLEILDDCLEGYAIFPGSQGRRDLFNWWLLEVIPAAWCLRFPESIYTIKGIISFNSKTLPNQLLNIFGNYRNQEIVKANNMD